MATKQVNIDIIAKDKTRQAMNSATKGVDGLKSSVFNLKNALIGLGAGVAIKSFIDVGKSVESLQLRLKFLFGSVQEGAKAFDVMSKFASRVPFSLEQIQAGSGNLAIVSKNADELAKMLEITGNVAGVVGLDFRTTAEQIQRSFTAGIASADIFRERGVRDMLGFSAGAKVSAKETAEAFERLFSGNGKFANATKDLAKTLEATFSMIGDTVFNFQKKVAESFFVGLKSEFGALDQALKDNQKTIDEIAKSIGQGLSTAIIATGNAVRVLSDNFEIIKTLGIALIVGKMATAFLNLAKAIGTAKGALLLFSKVSKTTVIGAFVGITTAILMMNEAVADGEEPNKKLNDLLEKKKLLELQLSKSGNVVNQTLQKQIEFINEQIDAFKSSATAMAMAEAGKQRLITQSKEYQDTLKDEMKRLAELEKANQKFITGSEIGQANRLDASMTGSELSVGGISDPVGALRQQLETEFELQKEMNLKHFQSIQAQDELEVELARIKADKVLRIAKETAEKEKAIRQTFINEQSAIMRSGQFQDLKMTGLTEQQKKDMIITGGKQILNSMSQNNKKAFQINKALNMADAFMNTATGVTKALASANIPMAILIGALGAVQIATIAQQKYQGRRLGGRMNQGQPYMVGEAGAELIIPDKPSNVVPNHQLGGMGKAVTVNFNINTVDARGFNELLVNSRATIVNMINSAINEKGNMAII